MKKALTVLVTALIPVLAATMTPSCAGGESVPSGSGGNGDGGSDTGSGGSNSSSGGKVGSGGSNASSGGKTGSGGNNSSSGGNSSSSGGNSSSGGKTGSGGSNASSGGSNSSSGGSNASSGGVTGTGTGGTTAGTCAMDATMSVMNGFAVSGTWMGYAYTYMGTAPSSITPVCGTTGTCFMAAAKQLCASGSVGPDTTYNASAGFGWNIGGMMNVSTATAVAPGGSGLSYNVQGLTPQMRFQIEDGAGVQYCANVTAVPSGTIPWGTFTKACYNTPPGAAYSPTTAIAKVGIVVPSDSGTARAFCFCVLSLAAAP